MTTFVLLRGLSRDALHWGDFGACLAAAVRPAPRVIALDLPGAGARWREPSPTSVPGIAAACREALRARLEAEGREGDDCESDDFVLVGLSLGGMVALQWCLDAPLGLSGCVLVNTSWRGAGAFWERMAPRNYPRVIGLFAGGAPQARERRILSMTSARPARHGGVAQAWAHIAREHPVRRTAALAQLLAASRYAPTPAALRMQRVPVLVLSSDGDRLVSPRCSRRLAAQLDAQHERHPWAGHDLPLDDPQWVAGCIARWRERIAPATGTPSAGV